MDNTDTRARFTIQRVVEETGLSADNLRAWEDRYGLPDPQRSPSGHRLYSRRDIALVNWLLARKQEGIRPNRAAQLYKELTAQGQHPLAVQAPPQRTAPIQGGRITDLREAWVIACQGFDEAQGEAILGQAFAQFTPATVLAGLLSEGLKEIGQGWLEGRVSVAQEHFASNLAVRKLNQLIAALPPATKRDRILVACPAGEEHYFPALLITYLVREAGYQAIYLGPDLPPGELSQLLASSAIDCAILAGTRLATAPELAAMLRAMLAAGIPAGYGGYIYQHNPKLRGHMAGVYLGAELDQIPAKLPALLRQPTHPELQAPAPLPFLAAFTSQAGQINAALRAALAGNQTEAEAPLQDAIDSFFNSLAAAARLGDLGLLEVEIDWLRQQLGWHPELGLDIAGFLAAFKDAGHATLGASGAALSEWLDETAAAARQAASNNQIGDG